MAIHPVNNYNLNKPITTLKATDTTKVISKNLAHITPEFIRTSQYIMKKDVSDLGSMYRADSTVNYKVTNIKTNNEIKIKLTLSNQIINNEKVNVIILECDDKNNEAIEEIRENISKVVKQDVQTNYSNSTTSKN